MKIQLPLPGWPIWAEFHPGGKVVVTQDSPRDDNKVTTYYRWACADWRNMTKEDAEAAKAVPPTVGMTDYIEDAYEKWICSLILS